MHKILSTILFFLLVVFSITQPVFAYIDNDIDYSNQYIVLDIRENGNWYISLNNRQFIFERHPGNLLKVYGGDVCYWLYEKDDKLINSSCDLKSVSILVHQLPVDY